MVCAAGGSARADDPAFEIASPEKIDVAMHLGASATQTLRIRNTGKTAITLALLSSVLADPATQGRLEVAAADLGTCAPAKVCDVTISLPRPAFAGAYAGVLTIAADRAVLRNVAIVIRSRGPHVIPGWYESGKATHVYVPWLPAALFWLLVVVGFGVSSLLDAWMAGGGRSRTTARLLLGRVRQGITSALARGSAWNQAHATDALLPAIQRWHVDLVRVEDLDIRSAELPIALLETDTNALARHADAARNLHDTLAIAETQYPGDNDRLVAIARALAAINPDLEPSKYWEACAAALSAQAKDTDRASMLDSARVSAERAPSLGRLRRHLRVMDALYAGVAWLVVGCVAHLTLYDRAFSFGAARDYIVVFLWTLGLTQTGSQVLARAKSSYSKP